MDILALVGEVTRQVALPAAEEGGTGVPDQPVLGDRQRRQLHRLLPDRQVARVQGPDGQTLDDRRARIEQGLQDAEQARRDRESAEQERLAAIQEARREANEIINRAQKVAAETREQDIAATREELARLQGARDRRDRGGEAAGHRRAARRGHRPRPRRRRARRRRLDDRPTASASSSPTSWPIPPPAGRTTDEHGPSPPPAATRRPPSRWPSRTDELDRWKDDLAARGGHPRPAGRRAGRRTARPSRSPSASRSSAALLESRIAPAALRLVSLLVERGRSHALPARRARSSPACSTRTAAWSWRRSPAPCPSPQTRPPRSGAGSRRWPVPGWSSARRSTRTSSAA